MCGYTMRSLADHSHTRCTQKEMISQTDKYVISLSSNTYVPVLTRNYLSR